MIALDSNIFIYLLEDNPEFGEPSKRLFQTIEKTYLNACSSELVFHEVLAYRKLQESEVARLQTKLERLGIEFRPVSKQILAHAAGLRRQQGLGAFDSIHVASALESRATHFVTNDYNLLKKKISGIQLLALANIKEATLFPRDINRLAPKSDIITS